MKGVKLTAMFVIASLLTLFLLLITPTLSSASPTNENLWSENNSVSADLTPTNLTNADGPSTGTWASASGKWGNADGIWTFTMENSSVGSGTIDNVVFYLKHYASGWSDDAFTIQIYGGGSWVDVRNYSDGDGPPSGDTTDSWDVYTLGIDTWDNINDSNVRIIGGLKKAGEDTVTWYVDTVSLDVKYNVTVAEWNLVETWTNATVGAPAMWQVIETWTNAKVEASIPAQWNLVETWTNAKVEAPTSSQWNLVETWEGTVSIPAIWQLTEAWTGTVSTPNTWQLIETWTGTASVPSQWQLIEKWTGTVSVPAKWQLIEKWTGTVSAPSSWQLIETWTGTVSISAAWHLTEIWTGIVEAPAFWYLIESWKDIVVAPAAWQLIESWTVAVEIVEVPSSSVDVISPYWKTSTSFTVTATAIDADGNVKNVELWHRYSNDNSIWGSWTSFGLDNDNSDGWSWSYTAENGDGYYEFHSIARDDDNYLELAPAEADARGGFDTIAPTITSIVIDDAAAITSSTSVTLSIDASDATSGLAEMQFSLNNVDWTDWESFIASKSYTLPTGDGLKTIYVQVKDKAGLSSTVASDSITLETILPPPPVEPTPSVEPQPVTPPSVEPQPVTPQPITPPPVEPQPITPAPTPPVTPVVPPPIQPPPFLYAVLFMTASVVGFAAVYRMLVRQSRYYVMLKRLQRAIFRPRVRHIGKLLPKPPARAPRRVSRVELAALRRLERVARKRFDLS